ncbi:hypothetical protein SALBM135S_01433 [Streptomyces alboniger]
MTNDLFPADPGGLDDSGNPDLRSPEATFALVFRQALRDRGLSLERICDRLHAQGISVSPATLSHWQRGRSQPERPQSLRAIDALEPMLGLRPGTLRSLLGPHRPRGRALPHDPAAVRGVYGEKSDLEQALGDAFLYFNSDTQALVTHETVTLDEHRSIREITVTTVLRAVQDGARQLAVVHFLDALPTDAVDIVVRYGELADRRFLPELRSVMADISFGRPLARNDTAVVEYTVHIGPSRTTSVLSRAPHQGIPQDLSAAREIPSPSHPGELPLFLPGTPRRRTGTTPPGIPGHVPHRPSASPEVPAGRVRAGVAVGLTAVTRQGRRAAAASSNVQPSISRARRSSGCGPPASASSSRARTAPGSCRFRVPPLTNPTSPEPKGAPPGTKRPGAWAKTIRSGPPVPAGCGWSVRVSRQSAYRPLPSTRWWWRSVHRYTRPSATSRRGLFG